MSQELTNIIRKLDEEFESHFKLISSEYSASCFGDSVALYSDQILEVRFSRDRGELICEFRRADTAFNWESIYTLFPSLPRSMHYATEIGALQGILTVFRENYSEILSQRK